MTNSTSQKRGRPTLLNRKVINQLVQAAQSGKNRSEMAAHVGVSVNTLQGWINQGRRTQKALLAEGRAIAPVVARQSGKTVEELTLELVFAFEVANRKRRKISVVLADDEVERHVIKDAKPLGRPSLLTGELVDAVTGPCAAGDVDQAAAVAGVDRRSILRWLERGRTVHLAGGATTEYERLCATLYASVKAASSSKPSQQVVGSRTTLIVLTEERVDQLVGAVASGANRQDASVQAGVSDRTVGRWLDIGKRVNATGTYASEHERLCGVLYRAITAVKKENGPAASSAGPDPVAGPAAAAAAPRGPVITVGRPARGGILSTVLRAFRILPQGARA
ncbi:helix-turn-helix domain-containing protein [Streptomyces sp. NPDC002812]|uniref:helix-turn-helix domain-containing protein n=1 Tax=Streptomyces sp. NPDC002812 TaxID=3154434 RepID=UPI00331887C3